MATRHLMTLRHPVICNTLQHTTLHHTTLQHTGGGPVESRHAACHSNGRHALNCRLLERPHLCDMTHSNVWHGLFVFVACLFERPHPCDMTHWYVWHDPFICVTWPIYMCDMTHLYVRHASSVFVISLNNMSDMTHSCVCHASFACVT